MGLWAPTIVIGVLNNLANDKQGCRRPKDGADFFAAGTGLNLSRGLHCDGGGDDQNAGDKTCRHWGFLSQDSQSVDAGSAP
jgi:hypothetical protein